MEAVLNEAKQLSERISALSEEMEYKTAQTNLLSVYITSMDKLITSPTYQPNVYIFVPLLTYIHANYPVD
jgi:hypothetical protein